MYCKKINVTEYRNIASASLEFSSGINILYGQNGSGKTNMAEALYYFAIAKSFRSSSDRAVVRNDLASPCASVEADFVRLNRRYKGDSSSDNARIIINRKGSNSYSVNGIEYNNAGFMGNFKAVLYTPDTIDLVKGAPADRRRFLDIALCQFDPKYFDCLKKYNFALKERNECVKNYNLLKYDKNARLFPEDVSREKLYGLIGIYTDMICKYGAYVMFMRNIYINKLKTQFSNFFRYVYGRENFDITIEYAPALPVSAHLGDPLPFSKIKSLLRDAVRETYLSDIEKGSLSYGPAKDDMRIRFGEKDAKDCTSQGQQKVIAIALKTAEGLIYKEEQDDLPLFILDDIMSELDRTTQIRLTEMFSKYQTIITTADAGYVGSFLSILKNNTDVRIFEVSGGKFKSMKVFDDVFEDKQI